MSGINLSWHVGVVLKREIALCQRDAMLGAVVVEFFAGGL